MLPFDGTGEKNRSSPHTGCDGFNLEPFRREKCLVDPAPFQRPHVNLSHCDPFFDPGIRVGWRNPRHCGFLLLGGI